ncbi:MAG: hypothetical protein R6U27_07260 [Desulfobacterales bacterium]
MDLYKKAHLVVAAIRLLEHQNTNSPSIEKVCRMLSFSIEEANLIIRRLKDMQIINVTEGAFGTRLFIQNHLAIENIRHDEQEDKMAHELEKFQKSQKERLKKIESIKAEQAAKKKNLFAEIEQKLRKDLEKK